MSSVILTLQVPQGGRGIPVATSADPALLRQFKCVVLQDWASRVDAAGDEVEALLARLELERVSKALMVLIPEGGLDGTQP